MIEKFISIFLKEKKNEIKILYKFDKWFETTIFSLIFNVMVLEIFHPSLSIYEIICFTEEKKKIIYNNIILIFFCYFNE